MNRARGVWAEPGVRRLIASATISNIGTEVTSIALPLIAISVLAASDFEVAALSSLVFIGLLLVGLPVGVVADRYDRRKLMVAADGVSCVVVTATVVLGFSGHLSIMMLFLTALALSVTATLHDVCSDTVMPDLVPRTRLDDANGLMATFRSLGEVSGPGLGGALISAFGVFAALVVDAISFLVSMVLLARLPTLQRPAAPSGVKLESEPAQQQLWRGTWQAVVGQLSAIGEGFQVYRHEPRLLRILATTTTSNFFSTMAGTVEILFLVRILQVPAWAVGVAFSLTAVGGLVGGVLLGPLRRRVGSLRILLVSQLVLAAPILLVPLARPGIGVTLYVVGWFAYSLSSVIYAASVITYRQKTVPRDVLGRASATSRWLGGSAAVLGALTATALVPFWGVTVLVVLSSIGIYASGFWLLSALFLRSSADEIVSESRT